MSNNTDEEKLDAGKSYPLDLASKLSAVKPPDVRPPTPLIITGGPPLRSIRILPQTTQPAPTTGTTIIATNIVPQGTIIKQGDTSRSQLAGIISAGQAQPPTPGNITFSRQITLQTAMPVVGQAPTLPTGTYHVPRGPAVVANLAAARSTAQGTSFVRPARTPSPAATWNTLANANGSQVNVKGMPTVLTTAPRMAKSQVGQIVSTIKPNTTILQSAIQLGQNQLHQFKSGVSGIQTINTNVALAQVVPARTQTLVYSTGTPFASAPRITVAGAMPRGQAALPTRPMAQVTAARLAVPVSVGGTRLLAPQGTVLTSGPPARILTTQTQANVAVGRLTVTVTNPSSTNPILAQMRSTLVHSVSVPTTNAQVRTTPTIHLTPMSQASRTINAQATIVAQRPATTLPMSKVYPQEGPANVYQLHAPTGHSSQTRRASPEVQSANTVPTTTTYSFYDGSFGVARTFPQQAPQGTTITAISQATAALRVNSVPALAPAPAPQNPAMRFNPIVVGTFQQDPDAQNMQATKITSSPRPSILRKREHDGAPLKAAKNLMASLSNVPNPPLSPPSRPDSRNNGHSSGGSTTISATSSPGLADNNEDSNHVPMNKEEEENRPPLEMSPRKKPRKQNLTTGNDVDEHIDDMQFISERDLKREQDDSDGMNSDGPQDGAPEARRVPSIRKPASASLLNSYKQTWKTTNNHYLRYSDVRPKDERRPTIIDLSNQHRVLEKVNGWKIHHLSTQMEDLAEQEHTVHSQLSEILKFTETQDLNNPDINRITELIKGNMQRVKIIKDGMVEANTAIMKIFNHKVHVTDIISRCASKRNYKKREKT